MKPKILIEYDGRYPSLCSGNLIVTINGDKWEFPRCCLLSGGYVCKSGDDDDNYDVTKGLWQIIRWPSNFPEEQKKGVIKKVNEEIPLGCCGGCI